MEDRQQQVTIRKAKFEDLDRLCEIYSASFGPTEPMPRQWWKILDEHTNTYLVAEVDNKVMGVAALITVSKILRSGSRMGLIEDVAVDPEARGLGLGKLLIEELKLLAVEAGCYKVVLNCSDQNVPFYEKCDFYQAENQMRWDRPKE